MPAAGRATVSATAGAAADAVAVAVRDSVTHAFPERFITDREGERELDLGTFGIPPHVPELGVDVRVEIGLSFDEQRDEAFAVGIEGSEPAFLGGPGCPVVPDDPTIGRAWKTVGHVESPPGDRTFRARHGIDFPCYEPVDDFDGANSVSFFGVRFVFYRID